MNVSSPAGVTTRLTTRGFGPAATMGNTVSGFWGEMFFRSVNMRPFATPGGSSSRYRTTFSMPFLSL
jgi:hypothetical protein